MDFYITLEAKAYWLSQCSCLL